MSMLKLTLSIGLSLLLYGAEFKIQAPSSECSYSEQTAPSKFFKKFKNSYIFSVSEIKNSHHRSEIRFLNEWYVKNANKCIEEKVRFLKINTKEFTFFQILEKTINPQPLLRMAWIKGDVWAIVRLNDLADKYAKTIKVDFGKYNNFLLKVCIEKGILKIYINHKLRLKTDVSYWRRKSYFKTGIYLQYPKSAKILIKLIKF